MLNIINGFYLAAWKHAHPNTLTFCKRKNLWCLPADLLADLSSSQILAQADLAECNSPLKIVQIGGDDLFENDETGANDFLLDPEAGLS